MHLSQKSDPAFVSFLPLSSSLAFPVTPYAIPIQGFEGSQHLC